ncbi:DUF4365 domain-containing protein [Corallococcus exiguus]|uniref:DUF4365 domain-containing protein n=1 Tax=Corallococcus exiguus TaxID=83462 RepID=UPI00147225B4|nr:DUF4365 domain-containing protein [Corallococcus exiguus]
MPSRPRSHVLEDISRARIREAISRETGWVVEDLHKDYGEDLFVRIFKDGRATPLSFFIQAKSSESVPRNESAQWVPVRIDVSHLRHWEGFWEPVFIVMHDSATGQSYWESIHYYLASPEGRACLDSRRKSVTMRIPKANRLDGDGLKRMLVITKLRSRRHLNEAEGARVLLGLLREAGVEIVDYDPSTEIIAKKESDGGVSMFFIGRFKELVRVVGEDGEWVKKAALDAATKILKFTRKTGKRLSELREEEKGDVYMFDRSSLRSREFFERMDIDEVIEGLKKRRKREL